MNRVVLLLYKTNVKHFYIYIIVKDVINKYKHIIYMFFFGEGTVVKNLFMKVN